MVIKLIMFKFKNHNQLFWFAVAETKIKTHYQILEIPSTAPASAVKKNYYKLAKIYHPDVYKGKDKTRFQKIQQAYKILSDQVKRRAYDEQLGLRKEAERQSPSQDPKEDFGKQKNPMDYQAPTEQINIDEEYVKFFNQKTKTQFEQIRMHEQAEFKSMSQAERVRRHFKEAYKQDQYHYKNTYQKTFNTILNDQIDQKNEMFKDGLKAAKKQKQNQIPKVIKKRIRYLYAAFALLCLVSFPIINSILTKYRLQKQQKQTIAKWWEAAEKEAEQIEIRQRFQY